MYLTNALLAVSSIAFVLALGEIGLRLAGISYPVLYQFDADLGVSLRPGSEGWWRKEGRAFIRINSVGMRDREHSLSKPPGTYRIAILGDSYAEALQLPISQTFWAVAEHELGTCAALRGQRPEVLNFGVSGFGTAQELLMLNHRVWRYQPDFVVLAFLTANDIRNNSRELEQDTLRPYFRWENERAVLDASFRDTPEFQFQQSVFARWKRQLAHHVRLAQVFSEGRRLLRDRFFSQWATVSSADAGPLLPHTSGQDRSSWELLQEAGLDASVYRKPTDEVWHSAWRVTESLVTQMAEEVAQQQAGFLLVTLSNAPQVHPDPTVRRAFAHQLGVQDLFYPDDRIRRLALNEGIPILTLAPKLQAYAEENQMYLHGFAGTQMGTGHWNATGHRVSGHLLAETLCEQIGQPRTEAGSALGPRRQRHPA